MAELRIRCRFVTVGLFLLLGAGGAAFAQTATGNLYGVVTDNEGARLPGVSVTLTGFGAPRVQVSDNQGNFRFLSLDPGSYALSAQLEGFSTVEYPSVNIRAARNTEVRVEVTPAVEEVITVTSESPVLDERKLMTGTSVSQIELEKIPTARDPWALLNQTPGVIVDRINVGGNESGQQSVFLGQGVSDDENDFMVDGIQITDMRAIGASSTYYDFDQFTEIQMQTGGTDVTKSTAGVGVNLVTKRGTNDFRGSARFYVTDGEGQFGIFDQADPEISSGELGRGGNFGGPDVAPQTAFIGNRINRIEDFGFEFGGPLKRDMVWLWGSWAENDIKNRVPGAGPGGLISDDTILESTSMKVNAQLSGANSAVASWNNGDKLKFGRNASPTRPPETTWNQRGPSAIWKAEDTHVFGSNFFLTGTWSKLDFGFQLAARGGVGDDAPRSWRDTAGVWHDTFNTGGAASPEDQYRLDGSYFFNTGQATGHEIKFGGRYRDFQTSSAFTWPGGDVFTDFVFGEVGFRRGISGPPISQEYTSVWVQDTISAGKITYNLGLRYDLQEGRNEPVQARANPSVPEVMPALDFPGADAPFDFETIAPRLGVTYALGEQRKTLLRASFSQFAEQLSSGDISRTNPVGESYVYFEDVTGSPWNPGDRLGPITFANGIDLDNPTALISPNITDPNYDPQLTSELVLGTEHAILPEFVVGLHLTYRETEDIAEDRRLIRTADGSVRVATAADYRPVVDPNTGGPLFLTGTLPDGQPYSVQVFGLDRSQFEFTGGRLRTNGDRTVEFRGIGLTLTKRLANRWMARGNFSWGEAEWNLGSEFRRFDDPNPTDTGDLANNTGGDIDGGLVGVQAAGSGAKADVILQATWSANLTGMYQIAPDRPWGFNIATNINAREGYPLPYFRSFNPGDGGGTRNIRVVDEIDAFRADDILQVDLKLDKELGATDNMSVNLSLDLFNATNEAHVLQRQRNLGTTNADYLRETSSPRIWRLGARMSWK